MAVAVDCVHLQQVDSSCERRVHGAEKQHHGRIVQQHSLSEDCINGCDDGYSEFVHAVAPLCLHSPSWPQLDISPVQTCRSSIDIWLNLASALSRPRLW
jgi:hypothetical protein